MKKDMYDRAELEIIKFRIEDVLAMTGEEDDETPFVPNSKP